MSLTDVNYEVYLRYKSWGPGPRLGLSKLMSWAKSPPQANLQARLGPAFFGLAWPGFWPQAKASTSLSPTAARIALTFFALEGPYSHLSLDSLNLLNGQLLAVFRLIQPGIAKTHIFCPFLARSLSFLQSLACLKATINSLLGSPYTHQTDRRLLHYNTISPTTIFPFLSS